MIPIFISITNINTEMALLFKKVWENMGLNKYKLSSIGA